MDWFPGRYFPNSAAAFKPYALLLLNRPISAQPFSSLHETASTIVCADGAANQLYNLRLDGQDRVIPHAIVGDLDSVHPGIREAYEKCGTDIIYDSDQESTDLTKSLKYIRWLVDEGATDAIDIGAADGKRALDVVMVGGLGGRVDQGLSLIHHMYLAARDKTLLRGDLFLVGSESVSFLLKKGVNRIHVPRNEAIFGKNIGIVPMGKSAVISTMGLEWDVHEWRTEFGGRMSTSNHIVSDLVEIDTSETVLFTVELEKTWMERGASKE